MCGRFAFYSPSEAAAALFGVNDAQPVAARYNIAPTQPIAAVRVAADERRELAMLRWGLVPFWAKDPSIGNRMINARAETVAQKPAFRAAYRHRRCVVLADGFYEWRRVDERKVPYFITLADGGPFGLAGLWEDWTDKETGERLQSATLITAPANDFMAALHHRMPMVVTPETANAWLAGDMEMIDSASSQCPGLTAWPVDRRVNNARNEGEELVQPAGDVLRSAAGVG